MAIPAVPTIIMRDGCQIPRLGLGTWPMDDHEAFDAISMALALGYRLFDTAARYGNEDGVGRALAFGDVAREELFVATKLRGSQHGYEEALAGFEQSRKRLGLDYVDLFLIHWPLPGRDLYVDTWRAFIHLQEQGLARSIGVSNFTPPQIERLVAETGVWPALNQVELHPDFARPELRAWHAEHRIATQAWSPLGAGRSVLADPTIGRLAAAHGRSPAQIVLRWHMQLDDLAVPKSSDPARMASNADVFDFALADDEIAAIAALDRGNRLGGDPDSYVEL
jgi:diketogulonate reductase-like aldo/keto reductase